MGYRAKDGRVLPSVLQGRRYDRFLDEQRVQTQVDRSRADISGAPGGPSHEHDINQHGIVTRSTIEYDGSGRWRTTSRHADGYESTSVHPEAHRAHSVAGNYLGIEPPPALATHQKARAHPVGPKEEKRVAKEDGRDDPYSRFEDFEEDK